jgi:hypothetical protein
MFVIDDDYIKLNGVTLPGIYKSHEVKGSAQVDEIDIKGKGAKPKQATGYQDSKIYIQLTLSADKTHSVEDKIKMIQNVFRRPNQQKPLVMPIVCPDVNARGITKVIFKDFITGGSSGKDIVKATIELWESVPITVTAKKKGSTKKNPTPIVKKVSLDDKYRAYLSTRGAAPVVYKTSKTPAIDNATYHAYAHRQSDVPY